MSDEFFDGVVQRRPDNAHPGVVIPDVTPVALQGNSPLRHYARADLGCLGNATAGVGFFYALVFPKANGMTIGIGTSSSYDLNRQHQPLDVIHYSEVMNVAAQIATGEYRLTDGPLTQRFFGDEAAYKARYARGEYSGDTMREKTDLAYHGGSLAHVMQKMHRDVWGDPLDEAVVIPLDADRTNYDLVVRFDDFLNRVVIGATPKNSAWAPASSRGGIRRLDPKRSDTAEAWEFRELLRFNQRTLKHAVARWTEAGAVRLPLRTYDGEYQLSGQALFETLDALKVEGALQGWDMTI